MTRSAGCSEAGTKLSRIHGANYVRHGTDTHSNTIEGVFSLIKRGVMGTFHSVSRKHLPNYLNEFEFRWNTRKINDGQRVAQAIKQRPSSARFLCVRNSMMLRTTWRNRAYITAAPTDVNSRTG